MEDGEAPVVAPSWTGPFWRRLAFAGARYGPDLWLRLSPTLIGAAFAAALPRQRRGIVENLRAVLGPRTRLEETVDVARTFMQYAHCLAESLAVGRPRASRAARRVRGKEHLATAVAQGRGVVIVTAHTGAWDAAAAYLGRDFDVDVMVAMAREANGRARQWHDALRKSAGVRVALVGADPLDGLGLLSHVRRGGVVAIQIDRRPASARTITVPWFGGSRDVPEGPFLLAATAGAPLLPVFARRIGYFDYEIRVSPAITVPRRPSPDDLAAAAGAATSEMARFVRAHPTQWFDFS